MKSTYYEYILEKILSTSEVGPILALIAMHIFKKQKQKEKQSIIKLTKQSIKLT
jgi:hypothetical protein